MVHLSPELLTMKGSRLVGHVSSSFSNPPPPLIMNISKFQEASSEVTSSLPSTITIRELPDLELNGFRSLSPYWRPWLLFLRDL
ncbi:hypothetical protein Pcinc_013176 [Petrolisthes cinctipes]|uniref:Uncharacterized protein n=1 Tax=Petrolisthes cinctipes TaxID=88211 RepID=A0AAE1G353_PETCI|nr:hypothetical protein Pcinc_013176 [Petrolisthes cinctipes]